MKVKNTKIHFTRFWPAIVSALYILVTGCTPPGPLCGDLVISRVTITGETRTPLANGKFNVDINYEVEFMNVGVGIVHIIGTADTHNLNAIPYYRPYLSTDPYLDDSDRSVGFDNIVQGPTKDFLGGEINISTSTIYGDNLPSHLGLNYGVDFDSFPYLIVVAYTQNGNNDCNQDNNTYVINRASNTHVY